jgi:xylan 1,4-beta-xylosidase
VASDHFVELGEPTRLLHGGFGLLTIGNLRKPRYWALRMLEQLGEDELASELEGDGAGSLVEAWASRHQDGRVAIVIWNGTLDQSKTGGDSRLDRDIRLEVAGLPKGQLTARHFRVDAVHSNVSATWAELGGGEWPGPAGWEALRRADRLEELDQQRSQEARDGSMVLEFELPMPSISLIEIATG